MAGALVRTLWSRGAVPSVRGGHCVSVQGWSGRASLVTTAVAQRTTAPPAAPSVSEPATQRVQRNPLQSPPTDPSHASNIANQAYSHAHVPVQGPLADGRCVCVCVC
jgi:hypothetical protein